MPTPISILHRRYFRRHRYIDGLGWVISNDRFRGRAQPKFNEAIQRTRSIDAADLYLNTIVFRETNKKINSFVGTSHTIPSSGNFYQNALYGNDLYIGDRLFEENRNGNRNGYALIIRSISELRDGMLNHDEVTCSEASQLDRKWVEPIQIGFMTSLDVQQVTGAKVNYSLRTDTEMASANLYYDPFRRQYTKLEWGDMNTISAFGIIEPFDMSRYDRDLKVQDRTESGIEFNSRLMVSMDASFPINEKCHLYMRGKKWKIEFIREHLTRVLLIGVSVWKQAGMSGDTISVRPNRF